MKKLVCVLIALGLTALLCCGLAEEAPLTVPPTLPPTVAPTEEPEPEPEETPAPTEAPEAAPEETVVPEAEAEAESSEATPAPGPTPDPTPTPVPKPRIYVTSDTVLMHIGDRDDGVLKLQQELIEKGYLQGLADGIYGNGTQEAVEKYATVLGISAPRGVTVSMFAAMYPDFGEYPLDNGDTGNTVYAVQKLLYNYGLLAAKPDSIYGEGTKEAVRQYMAYMAKDLVEIKQRKQDAALEGKSLEVPGGEGQMDMIIDVPIINEETVQSDGSLDEDWLEYLLSGHVPMSETVREGDRGNEALRIQRRLYRLGYIAAGVDGVFGNNSVLALKYFQRRSGMDETGIADEITQKALFSVDAERSDQYVSPYKAYVSTKKNKAMFVRWTGEGYDEVAKTFTVTTGSAQNPTVHGTFQAIGQSGEWYYMKNSNVWVKWAFLIDGNYFFHSVLFTNRGDPNPTKSSVANLGKNASHGCIRMAVEDCKWVYENCRAGMTVVIGD